jgi:catalase
MKVAVLAFPGFVEEDLQEVCAVLQKQGATPEVVSGFRGPMLSGEGASYEVLKTFLTSGSVLYDAVYVPGNVDGVGATTCPADALQFVREAFRHGKPIAAIGSGVELLRQAALPVELAEPGAELTVSDGVVSAAGGDPGGLAEAFVAALTAGRVWTRETEAVSA